MCKNFYTYLHCIGENRINNFAIYHLILNLFWNLVKEFLLNWFFLRITAYTKSKWLDIDNFFNVIITRLFNGLLLSRLILHRWEGLRTVSFQEIICLLNIFKQSGQLCSLLRYPIAVWITLVDCTTTETGRL